MALNMSEVVKRDNRAIASVEGHMTASRRNRYLMLEDIEFTWDLKEVIQFDAMWREGLSVPTIAEKLDRDVDEVTLLAIDRARKGRIGSRPGGVCGWQKDELKEDKPNSARHELTWEEYLAKRAEGLKDAQIATQFGVSQPTVLYWKRKWGIK